MTGPRLPAFQRKAPPKADLASLAGAGEDAATTSPTGQTEGESDPNDVAVCPACGCCFDDATGEVIPDGDPRHPAGGAGGGMPAGGPAPQDAAAGGQG